MMTRTIKGRDGSYIVDFRWGIDGWLPIISQAISVNIWDFIFAYGNRFLEMVSAYYGVDLEFDPLDKILQFYIDTGLIHIEVRKGGKLTDYAIRQVKAITKFYRDVMIQESNFI